MAIQIDPIEHIVYNWGDVKISKDEDFRTRRVLLIFTAHPFLERMPVELRVYGVDLKDATENLIREIQSALCHA